MRVVLPEVVSCSIYCYGVHEADTTRALCELLKPGDTFWDVGAHFGYFSVVARALVGYAGRVLAFEPTPRTLEVLRFNAIPRRIETRAVSLGERDGQSTLVDYGPKWSAFNSSHAPRLYGRLRGRVIAVPVRSLDSVMEEEAVAPTVLKIDAESSELAILRGGSRTIQRYRPTILLEVGDHDIEGAPCSREVIDYLLQIGYRVLDCGVAYGLRSHALRARYEPGMLVFRSEAL